MHRAAADLDNGSRGRYVFMHVFVFNPDNSTQYLKNPTCPRLQDLLLVPKSLGRMSFTPNKRTPAHISGGLHLFPLHGVDLATTLPRDERDAELRADLYW